MIICYNSETGWKTEVRLAGIGTNVHGKGFGYYRSDRELVPILYVESECMPWSGMEGVYRVVIGHAQPDRWKITSANPNVEEFLSGGGSSGSHIRSLWPQQLTPDRSGVV